MLLQTSRSDFDDLPVLNQLFLALWKEEKGYAPTKEFTFGELLELALAVTPDLLFDTPFDQSTRNNSLQYTEFLMGWDGSEPIETLWYELNEKLKRRIIQYLVVQSGKD